MIFNITQQLGVKCVWSSDIKELQKHFISVINGGGDISEDETFHVFFDMGSNLSKFDRFDHFSPATNYGILLLVQLKEK